MTNKMREEFEREYETMMRMTALVPDDLFKKDNEGDYIDDDVFTAHYWWNQSRESMKAIKFPELPMNMPIGYRIAFNEAINKCKDAITLSGYKIEQSNM